jgi:hypothetical protein
MKGSDVTEHPDDQPFEPDPDQDDGELPPFEVLVDMLSEVVTLLNTVDDHVTAYRRAAGDDHHAIARLQGVSGRIGDAWAATISARSGLRPHA